MDELKPQGTGKKLQIEPRVIKYGIIYAAVVFVIAAGTLGVAANKALNYKNIYDGVYIGDINLSDDTQESALQKITGKYNNMVEEKEIQLICKDKIKKVAFSQLGAYYDINAAAGEAFNAGRTGSPITRLFTILKIKNKHHIVTVPIRVNQEKLQAYIKELNAQLEKPAKEYSFVVEGERLKVVNGIPGEMINMEKASQLVVGAINEEAATVNLPSEIARPKPVTVEELSAKVFSDPVDASFEVKNYHLNVIPEVKGKKFDTEEAKRLIAQNKEDGQEFYIPLTLSNPKVYANQVERSFFKDLLATYTTNFNAGYVERTYNVALAANKINDIVLGVGDVFSYNDVVGPRTEAAGFKKAKIFVSGAIVDGLGGGICQVSSTLYNAVLLADLDIVTRINHSMTVSYVPVGQDATVADGAIDFKFKNSTKAPLKVVSRMKASNLVFELYGTNPEPGKKVEITNNIVSTIPFEVKRTDDPSLPEGKVIVQQQGSNGFVADTYKTIKRNGVQESKKHLARSRYTPITQIEVRGTKKGASTATPNPSELQPGQNLQENSQNNNQPVQQPTLQPQPVVPPEQNNSSEAIPPPEM